MTQRAVPLPFQNHVNVEGVKNRRDNLRFSFPLMSTEAIRALVKRALKSQGLRTTLIARRHEFKANHGFRKSFQTNVEPKTKSLDVMTLMGQDTGLAASYNKPTVYL